jgi:hypothetical protein
VVEFGQGESFAVETRGCGSVTQLGGSNQLQGNVALQVGVVSSVYDAHTAGSEFIPNYVMGKALADHAVSVVQLYSNQRYRG